MDDADEVNPRTPVDPEASSLSPRDLQDRAIKGALWTLLNTALSLPLAFAVNILIARVLGVVDYGRLAYLTTVIGLVDGVISLGIGTGLIQFGAKAHATGRHDEVRHLLGASQGFRLLVSLPVLTLVVISISDVAPWLTAVAIVFGVAFPAFFGGAPACFGIENKTAQGAQNAILVNIITQAAVVGTVLTIGTADAVWTARLAVGGLGVVLALFYVSPSYRRALFVPRWPRQFPPGFWRFSIAAGGAALVGSLIASRSEVLVLTWMSAVEAAGIFALAFGLINHLFGPAQALLGPLIPAVAGLSEVDASAVGRALRRTLRASATIVGLLVAGAVPALAFLVVPIYGEEYVAAPPVVVALGMAGGVMVVARPVQAFVQARLSGGRLLAINLVAVAVDAALMVALIPLWGVWGAVVGNVAASVVQLVLLLLGELRVLGLTWAAATRDVTPVLIGTVSGVAAWVVSSWWRWPDVVAGVGAGVIGALLVIAGLRITRTGLTPADVGAIVRVLPDRLRPVGGLILRASAAARDDGDAAPRP